MSTAITFAALTESWSAITATCALAHHGLSGDGSGAPTKLAADHANRVQPLAVDEDIGAFRVQHLAVGKVHLPGAVWLNQLSGIAPRQAW